MPVRPVGEPVGHLVRADAVGAGAGAEVDAATRVGTVLVDAVDAESLAQGLPAVFAHGGGGNVAVELAAEGCKGDPSWNVEHQQPVGQADEQRRDQQAAKREGRCGR